MLREYSVGRGLMDDLACYRLGEFYMLLALGEPRASPHPLYN